MASRLVTQYRLRIFKTLAIFLHLLVTLDDIALLKVE